MNTLTIIGLGASDLDQMSLGTYRALQEAKHIVARTEKHPVLDTLQAEGFTIESFDDLYEKSNDFEQVYEQIVEELLKLCAEKAMTYVVPGHPLVAEKTVQLLIEKERAGEIQLNISGGNSFLDPIFTALRIDPVDGFQLLDGTDLNHDDVHMNQHVLIGQVYDSFIASEVKLTLMEKYAHDYLVTIVTAAGSENEKLRFVPLFELDRVTEIDNLTTVYVPPVDCRDNRLKEWSTLREIIKVLRSPDGCPWDREQTHASLKKHLIEEAHELLEAIEEEDDESIVEELGDVLLQVFLHAQIGEDDGYFALEDVLEAISAKMIRRHPHVFGDQSVKDSEEVRQSWQSIKEAEKSPKLDSVLDGEMRPFSSLLTSYNYQKKAAYVGFDWPDIEGAIDKLREEWEEFTFEIKNGTKETQLDELGDVLFTIVNIARFLKVSPEEAMVHANAKFKSRFSYIEKRVQNGKGNFADYTLDELEMFWQAAKKDGKEEEYENR